MRFLHTLALTLLALAAVTSVDAADYVQHKTLTKVPKNWSLHADNAPSDHVLNYRIAVKQNAQGVQALETYLLEHSANPNSDKFGHHLTRSHINKMVAPKKEHVQSIVDWLAEHGITELKHSEGSDFLKFSAPVSVGNKLLNTQYKMYKHDKLGHYTIQTEGYHLPSHIVEHIDYITPTIHFPALNGNTMQVTSYDQAGVEKQLQLDNKYHPLAQYKTQAQIVGSQKSVIAPPHIFPDINTISPYLPHGQELSRGGGVDYASCSVVNTPHCLANLYGIATYDTLSADTNQIAVVEYQAQYAQDNNLQAALVNLTVPYYGQQAEYATFTVLGNGQNPQSELVEGIEADLDVQIIVPLAYPTAAFMYSVVWDLVSDSIWNAWLDEVLGQTNVPAVISTSYGEGETVMDYDYANRVCTEYMELGAQGVTLLFSSGDSGTSDRQTCGVNGEYIQEFPSGCPYVTSVGATKIYPDGTERAEYEPDIANTYTSGGGFSTYFPVPSWQKSFTANYLGTGLTADNAVSYGYYNPAGRGAPDVAAIGSITFPTYVSTFAPEGETGVPSTTPEVALIGGTSESSPIFASVMSLVNDYRLSTGRGNIGFINPALYAAAANATLYSQMFNDITQGFNYGCGPNLDLGFNATKSWDPVTGLGSPKFDGMKTYFATLGVPAPSYTATPYPEQDMISNDADLCENYDNCTPPPTTTSAPSTTSAPAAGTATQGSQYMCAPGFEMSGVSGTPAVQAGTQTSVTLVTVTNPGVALTGLTGCCAIGSSSNCAVQSAT